MAEALRPGNSGTLTPLPEGEPRIRRLRGSSATSSSEDAAGAGRGSVWTQGQRHHDTVPGQTPSSHPHPRWAHLWSPGRSSSLPQWCWGAGTVPGAGACGPGWPCSATRCCPGVLCPAEPRRQVRAGMGSPETPPPQPAHPQPPQQCWAFNPWPSLEGVGSESPIHRHVL